MLEGIRTARRATGKPFDSKVYVAYRDGLTNGRTESGQRIACYVAIWKRFGSWGEAMARAFP